MKKKSEFSSKKVSELKIKNKKKSEKVIQPKKNNDFFGNQEIKQDLQSFYNTEAKKYAETRKKFWHEEKAILDAISPLFSAFKQPLSPQQAEQASDSSPNREQKLPLCEERRTACSGEVVKKLRILEFWCGSGRFASLLNQQFPWQFDYVWIDLSDELLSYASKDNPNLTFFQWDITKLVKNFEQESFDLIVWTSSFQHIPTAKERSFLMKNFYRLLGYDGMLLMTNWSLSSWFVKKNWKAVWNARLKSRLKLNSSLARDIMVPRTDKDGKVYERFYHFFSLRELESLATFSWLSLKVNTFIDSDGNFTNNEKISRSSLLIARKTPIINM